ncbi:MAG: hypothetical protein J7M38_05805 [Armatimonadetes bacterium]|nr:hypothetical protein [Armatimonadota bacterium]
MKTKSSLIALVAVLAVVGVAVMVSQLSSAQTEVSNQRQVVAAVAADSVTEYEPDPFEPQRVRSSTVRVRQVAVVYSDGTVELKRVEN